MDAIDLSPRLFTCEMLSRERSSFAPEVGNFVRNVVSAEAPQPTDELWFERDGQRFRVNVGSSEFKKCGYEPEDVDSTYFGELEDADLEFVCGLERTGKSTDDAPGRFVSKMASGDTYFEKSGQLYHVELDQMNLCGSAPAAVTPGYFDQLWVSMRVFNCVTDGVAAAEPPAEAEAGEPEATPSLRKASRRLNVKVNLNGGETTDGTMVTIEILEPVNDGDVPASVLKDELNHQVHDPNSPLHNEELGNLIDKDIPFNAAPRALSASPLVALAPTLLAVLGWLSLLWL